MALQNLNQFKQTPVVGKLADDTTGRVFTLTCRFKDAQTTGNNLEPGTPVKLVDLGASDFSSPPIVDFMADDNDGGALGVALWDTKKNPKEDSDLVQVALEGSIVYLEASAAISRGASVAAVLAAPGEIVTATTQDILGVALDKAAADGDVIRVRIKPVAVST